MTQRSFLLVPARESVTVLAATLVAAASFGALNAFWFLGTWEPSLPGLWSYRSATLGDGLLLPALTASLVYLTLSVGIKRKDLAWAGLSSIVGASLFLAFVGNSVLSASPDLNWTLPRAHHLNSAGIYHAVAGSLIAGLVGGLLMVAFRSTRRIRIDAIDANLERPILTCWLIAAAAGIGFATSAAVDGLDDGVFLGQPIALYLGGLGLFTFAYGKALRLDLKRQWALLVLPGLSGTAIGLAAWQPFALAEIPFALAVALAANTLVLCVHFLANRSSTWFLELPAAILSSCLIPAAALANADQQLLVGVMLLVTAWLIICLTAIVTFLIAEGSDEARAHRKRENVPYLFAQGYVSYYLVLVVTLAWEQKASDAVFLAALLVPVTLGQLRRVAWSRYQALIEDEHVLGDDIRPSVIEGRQRWFCSSLEQSFWDTWLSLLGFGTAIIVLLIYSIGQQGILEDIETSIALSEPGEFRRPLMLGLLGGAAASAAVLASAALAVRSRKARGTLWRHLGSEVKRPTFALAATGTSLWLATPWLVSLADQPPNLDVDTWLTLSGLVHLAVLQAAIVVVHHMRRMTEESLQYNIARVESGRLGRRARYLRTLAGLAVASNCYWLLTVGIWNDHSMASLPVVAGVTAILPAFCVVGACFLGLALFRSVADIGVRPRHLALHHPVSNIFQDHVLMLALLNWVLVAAIYTGELLISSWPVLKFAVLPLFLASPFGVFFVIYVFLFKKTDVTSRQHVWRERARISHAMLTRAGNDPVVANQWNQDRADLIGRRFSDIQEFAGGLMIFFKPAIWLSDKLARLLPDQPMAFDLVALGPASPSLQQQLGAASVFYAFSVKGFESTPLDLALYLKPPDGDAEREAVRAFTRLRDDEILYIPLSHNAPPGEYELIIDLTLPENGGDPVNGQVITCKFTHQPRKQDSPTATRSGYPVDGAPPVPTIGRIDTA